LERILSYAEALQEATEQEMARDPSVVVFGIRVDDFKAVYGTTRGLVERFGPERVFDSPLSEDAMAGIAIGASLNGLRPIHVHIRMDFLLLTMNQMVNIAAKAHYMYGGAVSIPIVQRAVIGRSWGQGAQHSQGLHSLFMHIPGLRVVAPSTPYDAKGCLVQSIRDNNPVIFVEHRMGHFQQGPVPEELYTVPFGKARMLAEGGDITMVGVSYMAVECLRAARELAQTGVHADVIDPITLSPLDVDTIVDSVRKTGRLLVVDSDWTACGASAEIIAAVAERLQGAFPVQLRRMGYADTTCPTAKNLENLYYPDAQKIAAAAYGMVRQGAEAWVPASVTAPELVEFRGPF